MEHQWGNPCMTRDNVIRLKTREEEDKPFNPSPRRMSLVIVGTNWLGFTLCKSSELRIFYFLLTVRSNHDTLV